MWSQAPRAAIVKPMQTRTLGSLTTSAIGYGAMALVPGMYGDSSDEQSVGTLSHAIDAGATFLDTADAYGAGDNERLVGRAVAGRRDEVQLATKWGIVFEGGRTLTHHHAQEIRVDARPERAREALEASLTRLGVDHVDLWYLHFPDPGVPIEETVGAMAELAGEGKVTHLGLCNASAEQVLAAHQVHPIAAVQSEYSLWTRDPERELLPVLAELGVGFVPWSPLGAGFFAGSVRDTDKDFRANHPRFSRDNLAANQDRFAPLRGIADELRDHARPARAGLDPPPARGHRPDPEHPHPVAPRREPARRRRDPRRRDARANRRPRPGRCRRRLRAPLNLKGTLGTVPFRLL